MIRLVADQITVSAAAGEDGESRRSITAVAVPYDTWATVSDGTEVMFKQGSLPVDGKAPRVFMYHDSTKPVGIVAERVEVEGAMMAEMRISNTPLGDEALTLAADGVFDVSVGVNPLRFEEDDQGRITVLEAEWLELSLVPIPAFAGATITEVRASIHHNPDAIGNNPDSEPEEETTTMEDTTAAASEEIVPTAPIHAQAKRKFDMPSAAEYLAAYHTGGDTWHRVNEAFVEAQKSKQTALQAAAGDIATTNTPGLLPVPVLGPVFQDLNFIRPVVAAVGARAMPGTPSKTFTRPTITTHTSAAKQNAEFDPVSATTMVIAANTVQKQTVAGQVTLSAQDIDFTDPAALQIVLNDLAGEYLIATDNIAADAITAGAAVSGATWTIDQDDPSSLITALYGAAVNILSATNFAPDHLFVAPNVWELLGRQLDVDKRPIFPYAGAAGLMGVNAAGAATGMTYASLNPFGLRLVVDNNFAANTFVVARGQAIEFYEQVRGIMSVESPSTLGRVFSYYGYVGTFIADATQVQSVALA